MEWNASLIYRTDYSNFLFPVSMLNVNEVLLLTNVVPLNRRPGVTTIDWDSNSDECSFPMVKNINPVNTHWSQETSSSSIMRISRNIYKTRPIRDKTLVASRSETCRGEAKLKRLRKGIQPKSVTLPSSSEKVSGLLTLLLTFFCSSLGENWEWEPERLQNRWLLREPPWGWNPKGGSYDSAWHSLLHGWSC